MITRIGYSYGQCTVEADTPEEAELLAEREMLDWDFTERDSEYVVDGVYPCEP